MSSEATYLKLYKESVKELFEECVNDVALYSGKVTPLRVATIRISFYILNREGIKNAAMRSGVTRGFVRDMVDNADKRNNAELVSYMRDKYPESNEPYIDKLLTNTDMTINKFNKTIQEGESDFRKNISKKFDLSRVIVASIIKGTSHTDDIYERCERDIRVRINNTIVRKQKLLNDGEKCDNIYELTKDDIRKIKASYTSSIRKSMKQLTKLFNVDASVIRTIANGDVSDSNIHEYAEHLHKTCTASEAYDIDVLFENYGVNKDIIFKELHRSKVVFIRKTIDMYNINHGIMNGLFNNNFKG